MAKQYTSNLEIGAGPAMTPGEKTASVVNEVKERTLAEVDRTKREVRERT